MLRAFDQFANTLDENLCSVMRNWLTFDVLPLFVVRTAIESTGHFFLDLAAN